MSAGVSVGAANRALTTHQEKRERERKKEREKGETDRERKGGIGK